MRPLHMQNVCLQTYRNNRIHWKVAYFLRTIQTLRANNSRILSIKNAEFWGYYFYMNANILRDFQICISVPLICLWCIIRFENWFKQLTIWWIFSIIKFCLIFLNGLGRVNINIKGVLSGVLSVFYLTKSEDKNLNISRTNRAFKVKWKLYFIILKGLSVAKNRLRRETAPLTFRNT